MNVLSWPSNISSTPVEIIEQVAPLKVHYRRFREVDRRPTESTAAAPGRRCCSKASAANPATMSFMAERTREESAAPGLDGGAPGAAGEILIDGHKVNPKSQHIVEHGTQVLLRTPGGGGYGDPAKRPSSLVESDRMNGHTK